MTDRPISCTCDRCVDPCLHVPGWFAPADADRAIDAGLAGRMMLDWWEPDPATGNDETIYALCPAVPGHEGRAAPETPLVTPLDWLLGGMTLPGHGRCVLLTPGLRCEIHDSGHKPLECRSNVMCQGMRLDRGEIALMWNTAEGRDVVRKWKAAVGMGEAA